MIFGNWLVLALSVIVGVFALFTAAHSGDGTTYDVGLLVFVLAIAVVFVIIKRNFDRAERGPQ